MKHEVIGRARDALVPTRSRKAFNKMIHETGAGNHPEFLKLLYQLAPPKAKRKGTHRE